MTSSLLILLILISVSWAYWIVTCVVAHRFFRHRVQYAPFSPPVSILKPVKGVDTGALENFASFCRQTYPSFEILFGIAEPSDPAIPLVRQLQRSFPAVPIRLIVTPTRGTNRKVSLLQTLAREASHDVLVVNDSDMRVGPDYLARVVAPLGDPAVGIVTCPYRGEDPATLTARLEALHMGVTFLPSVVFAREVMDVKFALGATMVLRREDLASMGGFAAVADHLADDYEIGSRIGGLGLKVVLSDYMVASMLGETSFRDQWDRELRWARCNRASQPLGYVGYAVSFTTPLASIFLIADRFAALGWAILAGSILIRWVVGWAITFDTDDAAARRWLPLLPIRDMLSAVIWMAGVFGRRVVWRGESFVVLADGRLRVAAAAAEEGRWFSGPARVYRRRPVPEKTGADR